MKCEACTLQASGHFVQRAVGCSKRIVIGIALLGSAAAVVSPAQTAVAGQTTSKEASQTAPTFSAPSEPARQWAVDCANNEILVITHPDSYLRYKLHEVDEKGDRVRDQIETPQGGVARLIKRDGHSLTPDEDAAERERLQDLLNSPSNFERHTRRDDENRTLGVNLLRLMPDAMLWTYTEGQPQLPNQISGAPPLVVLDFKPNPKWSSPNMEADALTGLQGRIWIDPRARRMVRMEGNLFHAVNIGWGMVAHIYPGGTITLEQTNAGGQRWIVEHIVEQLTLRALLVKNVKQRLVFDTASYQQLPSMSYQQAIKMLLDTPLPSH